MARFLFFAVAMMFLPLFLARPGCIKRYSYCSTSVRQPDASYTPHSSHFFSPAFPNHTVAVFFTHVASES